ncbi:MAG: Hint domain-containing protein, partial [Acidocella sp.]|nr:Hint domain-containing protein [Acidocella sp.]
QASSVSAGGGLMLGGASSLNVAGQFGMTGAADVRVGRNTALRAQDALIFGGSLAVAGQFTASGAIFDAAATNLVGGTVSGASFTLATAGFEGNGLVNAPVIVDDGTMIAQGGTLVLAGTVNIQSLLQVSGGADLELTGTVSGPSIDFIGTDAVVTVDDPALLNAGFKGMQASDAIDLVGVNPNLVTYAGGSFGALTIFDSLGNTLALSSIEISPGAPAVSIAADGFDGTLITLGGELPCFARGTGLLSPHGYRAVESLKPGDPLITASGGRRAVRWIGRRVLDFGGGAWAQVLPVLIRPGAFGPGVPARPLRLSPSHCVYQDGVLVPVTHLVNGATILREAASAVTYYHIELDRHDVLLAEGLSCESYFDDGNRGALYHETGRRTPARRPCAPRVTGGPKLAAMRRRLHGIALAAGYGLTYWPVMRAMAAGCSVVPQISQEGDLRVATFGFAEPVREVALFAQTHTPADTDPDSEDQRELGVCIVPNPAIRPGSGFYPRAKGDRGLWMGKTGVLSLRRPAQALDLTLSAVMQSWLPPRGFSARD